MLAFKAALVIQGLKGSKRSERQGVGSMTLDTNFLSDWKDKEEDFTDGGVWDDEKSEGDEGSES
jgi:hypothetical protein